MYSVHLTLIGQRTTNMPYLEYAYGQTIYSNDVYKTGLYDRLVSRITLLYV